MSVIMLSTFSSSILNSSRSRAGDWPDFEEASELVVEEVSDSGTLFAEILETASSDKSGSLAAMSESESDDDILEFLTSKNYVKPRSQRACAKNISTGTSFNSSDSNEVQTLGDAKTDVKKKTKCKNKEACMNKGAVNARIQRMKKKRYIDELEGTVDQLESQNKLLTSQMSAKSNQIDHMKKEIHYLKSIIANHTSLTSLLNHIPFSKGMQFGSSLSPLVENKNLNVCQANTNEKPKKREREEHSDSCDSEISIRTEGGGVYVVTRAAKKLASEPPVPSPGEDTATSDCGQISPGVCLHVSSNNVSLEFCASCASNAALALSAKTDGTDSDKENANVLKAG